MNESVKIESKIKSKIEKQMSELSFNFIVLIEIVLSKLKLFFQFIVELFLVSM